MKRRKEFLQKVWIYFMELWRTRYIRLYLHAYIPILLHVRSVIAPASFLPTFNFSLTCFMTRSQDQYYLWHTIRSNISLPEKFPALFPFSHFSSFLNYRTQHFLPGRAEIQWAADSQSLDTETTTPILLTWTQPLSQPLAKHRHRKAKPRECIKYLTSKNLDHLTTIITVLHPFSIFSIKYTSLISTINILSQLAYFNLPHTDGI